MRKDVAVYKIWEKRILRMSDLRGRRYFESFCLKFGNVILTLRPKTIKKHLLFFAQIFCGSLRKLGIPVPLYCEYEVSV